MSKAIFSTLTERFTTVLRKGARALVHARNGNIAMIFAISIVPVMVAGAAGIDLARTLAVRSKLYAAVDAAALAVASKYSTAAMTDAEADALADQYFRANYALDNSFGSPSAAQADVDGSARSVTVTTNTQVPTTLMNIAGIRHVNLTASSNVVWGQTRIWVGLALDTTGSMAQGDATGTKIAALKTAVAGVDGLFDVLENAAASPGDVKLSLIPFARQVNVLGISTSGLATWLDWTAWDETNGSCALNGVAMTGTSYDTKTECLAASVGACSAGSQYTAQSQCDAIGVCSISGNTTQASCQAASTGTCSVGVATTRSACESTVAGGVCSISNRTTQITCTATRGCTNPDNSANRSTCEDNRGCSISGYSSRNPCQNAGGLWRYGDWGYGVWSPTYATYTPTVYGVWTATPGVWSVINGVWTADHAAWTGCVTDRGLGDSSSGGPANASGVVGVTTAGYDTNNEAPSNTPQSKFKAVSANGCAAPIRPLGYDWATLKTTVNALGTNGATNQPIGLAWAWHSLTNTDPMNSGTLPSNTTRYIIIVSDGENTADRWYGNGSNHSSSVDNRMNLVCTAAKADGVIIYALFINIAGTAGNSASMKNCATGGEFGGKYYEVSATGNIGTALDAIAQQITNLRVAR